VDMLLYFLQESEAAMMKEREWLKLWCLIITGSMG
jgi:hypothetical protein